MSEVMCKGAYELGNACGKCSRCHAAEIARLSAALNETRAQRDAYRAMLEGAEYQNLDALGNLSTEQARDVGKLAAEVSRETVRIVAITMAASQAVTYVIRRAQRDARLASLIGPGTQCWDLLTGAAALAAGRSVDEYRAAIEKTLRYERWPSAGDIEDRIHSAVEVARAEWEKSRG